MKKSLLGLLIALATFSISVLTVEMSAPKQVSVIKEDKKTASADFGGQQIPLIEFSRLSQSNEIEKTEEAEFIESKNIHAWYSLNVSRKMPEVAMINFYGSNVDDNGDKLNEMVYETGIYTHFYKEDVNEGFAEGIETKVEGNKLKFKTKKLKGIEYSFQGTFFKNKMTGKQDEEILRGTLQKYIKGKKVAEVSGNFAYGEPYCLH